MVQLHVTKLTLSALAAAGACTVNGVSASIFGTPFGKAMTEMSSPLEGITKLTAALEALVEEQEESSEFMLNTEADASMIKLLFEDSDDQEPGTLLSMAINVTNEDEWKAESGKEDDYDMKFFDFLGMCEAKFSEEEKEAVVAKLTGTCKADAEEEAPAAEEAKSFKDTMMAMGSPMEGITKLSDAAAALVEEQEEPSEFMLNTEADASMIKLLFEDSDDQEPATLMSMAINVTGEDEWKAESGKEGDYEMKFWDFIEMCDAKFTDEEKEAMVAKMM